MSEDRLKQIILEDSIDIDADASTVYKHFMKRPNKFPSSRLFETKFMLILRGLSTGSIKGLGILRARRAEFEKSAIDNFVPGSSYGPFSVCDIDPDKQVRMKLLSGAADADIDMIFDPLDDKHARLTMRVVARPNSLLRRAYFPIWRPLHPIMAKKMLAIFKREIEEEQKIS